MEIFLLYLFTRLNIILTFAGIGLAILLLGLFMTVIVLDDAPEAWKRFQRWRVMFYICLGIVVVVPTQESAAMVLGGYAVLEAAKTETAGRLASKSVQLIEQTLDSFLKKEEKK